MENLENLFKKFIYTGVGLVSITKEKLQKTVDELVKDERISTQEGEKIVDEFFKNTEGKRTELEGTLKGAVEKIVSVFSFASAKEVAELSERVKNLEAVIAGKEDIKDEEKTENV